MKPVIAVLAAALLTVGCSGPRFGSVRGRVTCQGKPVTRALILFAPMPAGEGDKESGKPCGMALDADGRFSGLTTFRPGDGALVGRHRVVVTPEFEFANPGCYPNKEIVVEVKEGENEINIELTDYHTGPKRK